MSRPEGHAVACSLQQGLQFLKAGETLSTTESCPFQPCPAPTRNASTSACSAARSAMISLCGSCGGGGALSCDRLPSSICRKLEVSDPRLCSLGRLKSCSPTLLRIGAPPRRGGGAGGAAPLSCRGMLLFEALEDERMWDEPRPLFEGLRRGGGGMGLVSDTGLLGSVVGGVSTEGLACCAVAAGGLCDRRAGGGGGTAFEAGLGVSSSSCMEFWVKFEPLRLRLCVCACLREDGGGGGGTFFGWGTSKVGVGCWSGVLLSAVCSCEGNCVGCCTSGGGGSGLFGSGLFKSLLGDLGVEGRKIPCSALLTGGVLGPGGCCQP